jgi:ribose-phosphate pyrophosphokinase
MTTAVFGGSANPALARALAEALGLPLAACSIERFPDSEIHIVLDEPVRRRDVVLVQPTSPPVDANLLELLAFVDACRRAAAKRIVAVVPYFGYARSDRRSGRREAIMANLAAQLLEATGVDHLVSIDLHAPQVEGFFQIPVDCLSAVPVLARALEGTVDARTVVVSPDMGRVTMAADMADRLGLSTALIEKRREDGASASVLGLIGDVHERPCLIVDDIIATGTTVARAIERLRAAGARAEVSLAVTHGLFLEGAVARLADAGVQRVITTDTIALPRIRDFDVKVATVAPILASAIGRLIERPQ